MHYACEGDSDPVLGLSGVISPPNCLNQSLSNFQDMMWDIRDVFVMKMGMIC